MNGLVQIPAAEEDFPTDIESVERLRNHPMNNPTRFREVILAMGREQMEIDRQLKAREISSEQAEKLRTELKEKYLSSF